MKLTTLFFLSLFITSCSTVSTGKINYKRIKQTEVKSFNKAVNQLDYKQVKKQEGIVRLKQIDYNDLKINHSNLQADVFDCDELQMKDGQKIKAKIILISNTVIKYIRCDSEHGPTYVVDTDKVYGITYADGTKELINHGKVNPYVETEREESKNEVKPLVRDELKESHDNSNSIKGAIMIILGVLLMGGSAIFFYQASLNYGCIATLAAAIGYTVGGLLLGAGGVLLLVFGILMLVRRNKRRMS